MKLICTLVLLMVLASTFAESATDEVKMERPDRIRLPNLKELWKSNQSVQRITAETYMSEITQGDPD